MRKVKTYDIGGIPTCRNGVIQELYTFQEMISDPIYDMKEYQRDKSIEETDQPIGWIFMMYKKGKAIFIEIQQYEKYEIIKDE